MATHKLNDPKIIRGWAFFDWANSAYSLVITTAIFPIYFIAVAPETVNIWGLSLSNSALYSFSITVAYILIAAVAPILGGIADAGQKKMFFLKMFTTFGAIACCCLFLFTDASLVWLGTLAFMCSTFGYAGSLIFYDAFLPVIATPDRYDAVSARGYAYGYIGSVILLVVILAMSQFPTTFGFAEESSLPYRVGFAMVGLWWFIFAQYSFSQLPKDQPSSSKHLIWDGYKKIQEVSQKLMSKPNLRWFLGAFFLYTSGVNTIIYLATVFAEKELGFESSELILTVLILQLVAIVGALLFSRYSEKRGPKEAITVMILIWMLICVFAYFVTQKAAFFGVAFLVGLVLGGIQSTSRATFSKLIRHEDDHNSYFSYYDLLYYLAIVFGTFAFGLVESLTHSLRNSVLILGLFFAISLLLWTKVKIESVTTLSSDEISDHITDDA